jgi:hypothetical protein
MGGLLIRLALKTNGRLVEFANLKQYLLHFSSATIPVSLYQNV